MTDQPVRVLHVEPDDAFAATVAESLRRFAPELSVDRVADAAAARGRLDGDAYDAVIAAGALPDGSGIDLLATVREADPDIPFLLLTGTGSEAVAAEAVREGATDYLRKGEEGVFGTLAARIRSAVTGYRAELARRERSKELATLHAANAILGADRPLDDRLSELTTALPAGWRHPERTAARIRTGDRLFVTPNFSETAHTLTATASVADGESERATGDGTTKKGATGDGTAGDGPTEDGAVEITVAYLGEAADGDDPFLPEEQRLLDSVAAVVAAHVGRERSIDRLRASTERLSTILEHTTNLVFMKDLDGRYLLVNDAFAEFLGREKDAIVGESVEALHPDSVAEWVTAHDRETVAAGEPTRFEERAVVDGERRAFLTVRVPLFDADGEPYAVYGIATDITAQRRAADERATLLDRMTDGFMAVDADDTITFINDHGAAMVGRDHASLTGTDLREAFDEGADAFLVAYDRAVDRGDAETAETYYPPADAWYESRIYSDETGASVYFRDVSDRVRDRRRLEQFEHIVETVHDGVLVVDADGEIRFVNQYVVDRLGRDRDALVGSDVSALLRPSDRGRIREVIGGLAAGESHDGSTIELTIDAADGPLPVEVRKTPLYHGGEFWGVVAVVRDVTERHAERRELEYREDVMRRLYETIAEKDTDFEAKVRSLLELGKEVIGAESGLLSRIDGDDYVGLVVEDDTGAFEEGVVVDVGATNCERVVATERSLQVQDVSEVPGLAEREGHTQLGVSCYVGAPVVVDGEVFGTFCFYDRGAREGSFDRWEVTLVDLMARWVSYELERRRTQAELERERDRLEEFASVVSHDLRNPLNVAEGNVDLAREGDEAADLDAAASALARMNELIDDALSFARLGSRVVETEPTDIGDVAREAWETVDTDGASLTVEGLGVADCDASRVRSLFENLFRNAVEHVGPDVRVTVGRLEDGFYVADDGPGIPADVREHAFERGYTTSETGTGFGLAIVDQIAGAHGWTVDLVDDGDRDEENHGGARFEVRDVHWLRS